MLTSDFEYFHYKDKDALNVEYHNHDFHEIYLYLSGDVTYCIEGRSYTLRPGDFLLIHNREVHKPFIKQGEPYERIVLWVNPDYLLRKSKGASNLCDCFRIEGSNNYNLIRPSTAKLKDIFEILERFEKACNGLSLEHSLLRDAYLVEYIACINAMFHESFDKPMSEDIKFNENINKVVSYINDNLGECLSLELLSKKFYMSKYHLAREFKKYTGYTIHQFIQQKRFILAKTMLKKGISVSNVCSSCGFNDYANFIRNFKKYFGMPPKKYAESQHRAVTSKR
ncbi:MAG: AraC family transcriptional regulator [Eubacteriales bacterium]|nr:AraC family transcriptional regulator [Eubacteriales bacterium]